MLRQLYKPRSDRKMRVVVMFSGSASSLRYLLENDSNLNGKYEIVGTFSDVSSASGLETATNARIPTEALDYRTWIKSRNVNFGDLAARDEYFKEVVEMVDQWKPDIIMQSGFMLITTESFINHFEHKILNVHPADLTILDEGGKRKYTGLHVIERALADGVTETRSTIHLVTSGVDEGPILLMSDPLPVVPNESVTEHQEKMKWACDGPAYQRALDLIADGLVWLDTETGEIVIRES